MGGRRGKKNKSQVLAALTVLELGSAHTTALTHLLAAAGIPREGFSLEVKHSTLEAKKTVEVLEKVAPEWQRVVT